MQCLNGLLSVALLVVQVDQQKDLAFSIVEKCMASRSAIDQVELEYTSLVYQYENGARRDLPEEHYSVWASGKSIRIDVTSSSFEGRFQASFDGERYAVANAGEKPTVVMVEPADSVSQQTKTRLDYNPRWLGLCYDQSDVNRKNSCLAFIQEIEWDAISVTKEVRDSQNVTVVNLSKSDDSREQQEVRVFCDDKDYCLLESLSLALLKDRNVRTKAELKNVLSKDNASDVWYVEDSSFCTYVNEAPVFGRQFKVEKIKFSSVDSNVFSVSEFGLAEGREVYDVTKKGDFRKRYVMSSQGLKLIKEGAEIEPVSISIGNSLAFKISLVVLGLIFFVVGVTLARLKGVGNVPDD